MPNHFTQILTSQFEAALCMLHHCIAAWPRATGGTPKIANATVRQTAYHTLFFTDLYLSPSASTPSPSATSTPVGGGDEPRGPTLSPGLDPLRNPRLPRHLPRQVNAQP